MRLGIAACALVGFVALGCSSPVRTFPSKNGGAGGTDSGGKAGNSSAGSGTTAGRGGVGGGGNGPSPGADAGADTEAGAAGMAGEGTVEPPDPCVGKVCNTPPTADCQSSTQFQSYDTTGTCVAGECSYVPHSISCACSGHMCTTDPCLGLPCATPPAASCKDANTRTSYAASGTCSAGSCSYVATDMACAFGCAGGACKADPCTTGMTCTTPPAAICKDASTRTTYAASGTCSAGKCSYAATDSACTGDTNKCKAVTASSQCVACLANADCSNGGTCNGSNACVCSARFNGKHCEFQVFRGLGTLQGDTSSSANNISHDGSVVIGTSVPNTGSFHAFKSVNGAALQFISTSGCTAWNPTAVDSAGNVLLTCSDDGGLSLYSVAGTATPITWPTGRVVGDISLDGKVIVGGSGEQAIRRVGSVNTLLGPLQPGGASWFNATNSDGSIAVGRHNNAGYTALRWTSGTGLVALTALSGWINTAANDVSTDGKVIVGWASLESEVLSGQVAVKWSGASLTPTALSASSVAASANAVNLDGSVIVGSQSGSGAMLWDSAGGHTVKSLLGATPDLTSDWSLDSAVGVSDDGKFVVGGGTHQTHGEGWVAHLP